MCKLAGIGASGIHVVARLECRQNRGRHDAGSVGKGRNRRVAGKKAVIHSLTVRQRAENEPSWMFQPPRLPGTPYNRPATVHPTLRFGNESVLSAHRP